MTPRPLNDRAWELLADRATQGLAPQDAAELDSLLLTAQAGEEIGLDLAAAAAQLALEPAMERAPEALRSRLAASARAFDASGSSGAPVWSTPAPSEAPGRIVAGRISPGRSFAGLGWLAAAACLAIAILGWLPKAPAPRVEIAAADRPDAITWSWGPAAPDSRLAAIEGDAVFSPSAQQGVLRLRNLPALDETKQQYQLWIVDPERKQPVDGGVFDAPAPGADGTVSIAFTPRLRVESPGAFAITIERRGGVVVSDGPLAAVATPPKG